MLLVRGSHSVLTVDNRIGILQYLLLPATATECVFRRSLCVFHVHVYVRHVMVFGFVCVRASMFDCLCVRDVFPLHRAAVYVKNAVRSMTAVFVPMHAHIRNERHEHIYGVNTR